MTTMIKRQVTLVVAGENEEAFQAAIVEAARLISEGNLSGANSTEGGGFYFNSNPHVHDAHLPRIGEHHAH